MAKLLAEPIEVYSDDYIKVLCMDEQGAGGAHHLYHIYKIEDDPATAEPLEIIKHQEGPILENGVNGSTNEAHIAIIIHRLDCFDKGPFRSRPNSIAKTHIETGKLWLEERTRERKKRSVEGTSQK